MNNTFLNELLDRQSLPRYDLITPDQVAPAIDQLLANARDTLAKVTSRGTADTWESVMEPFTDATERLSRAWSAVHHMSGVMDSPEWRDALNSRLSQITAFWTDVAQDPALFAKTKAIAATTSANDHPARARALENSLRAFRLGGAELGDAQKKEFAELQAQLAQLQQKFSEQLLDSTNATVIHVQEEARLDGIPEHAIA
jgi:oligopeptidase A